MERHRADSLIRTKLRLPFTRPGLVSRPGLQARLAEGLCGPLTLVTAPAGFGKTTLVASYIAGRVMPVAWLSLDRDDSQADRFLSYLIAALQQADPAIGRDAAQRLKAALPAPADEILTSLINDLDAADGEMALVLDDYQSIDSQAVHQQVAFLLEFCPRTFHLVTLTRLDPPLPLTRLRARGQTVELRAADLAFSRPETDQFLNGVMGLGLDAGSVAALEKRTEGWIAGLQMAALSLRDRQDVAGFIAGFSGTHRYIMDYLLEEVLAGQPPEIQRFLLHTSILERLTAPLCDALLGDQGMSEAGTAPDSPIPASQPILEYLERANLFLLPLDDERTWYRYHQLFADLLRTQLHKSLGAQGLAQLHVRAAEWHARHGSLLEAIHHASLAADDERVERLIEQNYLEMVSRGEMAGMRYWAGKLSQEAVYRRPWLCIYEAYSHAWFGDLDKADRLLEAAKTRLGSHRAPPDAAAMRALLAYVQSRVTAMRGDLDRAIAYCLQARQVLPAGNPALEWDTRVTLGYEYFLAGDYVNASSILDEAVRSGIAAGAIIHTVSAACMLARLYANQGLLHKSYAAYRTAAQVIPAAGEGHADARGLVEAGLADLYCEWDDLDAALVHLRQGLALLPFWGKADDSVLAYRTLARIHLAEANPSAAKEAVEKAIQLLQSRGVFSEARQAAEVAQVKLWLAQGALPAADHRATKQAERLRAGDRFRFENELVQITQARVWVALDRPEQALGLLSHLEESARSAGRMGRVLEILMLRALALQARGDPEGAVVALTECLTLAEPEGYVQLFLDEGRPLQMLLAQGLAHAGAGPMRDYVLRLLARFHDERHAGTAAPEKAAPAGGLVEPLSQREREVLHLLSLGTTNQEIARQLIVATGTVKAHTASIYRKLDVANRTEAVARARQLGLVP